MHATAWFRELGVGDADVAGGKGANLGELTAAGLPVPPGFVVTSEAYLSAIEASGAREKLEVAIVGLDADSDVALTAAFGAWEQMKLPEKIFDFISDHVRR